eukprot:7217400-Prorocentrum_lima.AAC.1
MWPTSRGGQARHPPVAPPTMAGAGAPTPFTAAPSRSATAGAPEAKLACSPSTSRSSPGTRSPYSRPIAPPAS